MLSSSQIHSIEEVAQTGYGTSRHAPSSRSPFRYQGHDLWPVANLPRIKILVTTGDTSKNVLPEVLGKILAKPYANGDLLERVQHALAT